MQFSGKAGNGPLSKLLNFGGDLDNRLDTGIVFRIHQYWEIHTDLPDGGTGKTCLGGGMPCPSASSLVFSSLTHSSELLRHRKVVAPLQKSGNMLFRENLQKKCFK